MKKLRFISAFLMIATLVAALVSCSTDAPNEGPAAAEGYKIYKNFDSLPSLGMKDIVDGEEVVGVLLKYTSEGAYSPDVTPIDAETFCIYCLFDQHGTNGDGMEFNYVLYVPEDIQNKYTAGGGKNPTSGNPFWWYMLTYLDSGIEDIHNNWPAVIEFLCGDNELPVAGSADVTGIWLE